MAGVVLAGVVAVALLALAAGATAGITRESASDSSLVVAPRLLMRTAIALIGFVVAASCALAVWAWWPRRGRRRREEVTPVEERRPTPPWWAVLVRVAIAGALLLTVLWALHRWSGSRSEEQPHAPPASTPTEQKRDQRGGTGTDWIVLGVAAGAGVIVVATWLRLVTRPRPVPERPERTDLAVAGALDESLDLLDNIADPAAAIIAAYAHMERVFAAAGSPREPWEAPFEFVDRILLHVGASAVAVAELSDLFERAKFAPHPVDAGMRDAAVAAVRAVRDELRSMA